MSEAISIGTFAPVLGPALPTEDPYGLGGDVRQARRIADVLEREAWVKESEAGLLINDDGQIQCACIRVTDAANGYWLYLDTAFGEVLDHD